MIGSQFSLSLNLGFDLLGLLLFSVSLSSSMLYDHFTTLVLSTSSTTAAAFVVLGLVQGSVCGFHQPLSLVQFTFVDRTSVGLDCPSLDKGDSFTQSEFLSRLANECRYDRLLLPTYQTPGDVVYVHASAYVYFIQPAEAHDLVSKELVAKNRPAIRPLGSFWFRTYCNKYNTFMLLRFSTSFQIR